MPPRKGMSKSGSSHRPSLSLSHSSSRQGLGLSAPTMATAASPMTSQFEQHLAFPARLTSSSKKGAVSSLSSSSVPAVELSVGSTTLGTYGTAPPQPAPSLDGSSSSTTSSTQIGAALVEVGSGDGVCEHIPHFSSSSSVSPLSRRLTYGGGDPTPTTTTTMTPPLPESTSQFAEGSIDGGGSTVAPGQKRPRSDSVAAGGVDEDQEAGREEEEDYGAATVAVTPSDLPPHSTTSHHLTPTETMALNSFRSFQVLRTITNTPSTTNNSPSIVSGAASQLLSSLHGLLQRWGAARRQLFIFLVDSSNSTTNDNTSTNTVRGSYGSPIHHHRSTSSSFFSSSSSVKKGGRRFTHHSQHHHRNSRNENDDEEKRKDSLEVNTMNVCNAAVASFLSTECVAVLSDPSFGLLAAGAWLQPPHPTTTTTSTSKSTSVPTTGASNGHPSTTATPSNPTNPSTTSPDALASTGLGTTVGFIIGQLLNTAFVSSPTPSSSGCAQPPQDPFLSVPTIHPLLRSPTSTSTRINNNKNHPQQKKKSATTATAPVPVVAVDANNTTTDKNNNNPVFTACCQLIEAAAFAALREHELHFSGGDMETSTKKQQPSSGMSCCYWITKSIMPVLQSFMRSLFSSIEATYNNNNNNKVNIKGATTTTTTGNNNSSTLHQQQQQQQRVSYHTRFKDTMVAHMCNTLLSAVHSSTPSREYVLITPLSNTTTGYDDVDAERNGGGLHSHPTVAEDATLLDLCNQQQAYDGNRHMKKSGLFETTAMQFRRDVLNNMYGDSDTTSTSTTAFYHYSNSVEPTTLDRNNYNNNTGAGDEESVASYVTGCSSDDADNQVGVVVRCCMEVIRNCSSSSHLGKKGNNGKNNGSSSKLQPPPQPLQQQQQPGPQTTTTTATTGMAREAAVLELLRHVTTNCRSTPQDHQFCTSTSSRVLRRIPSSTPKKNGPKNRVAYSVPYSLAFEQLQQDVHTSTSLPQYTLVECFRMSLLDGGDIVMMERLAQK